MSTETSLIGGVLFGAFGLGYFVYGKRQRQRQAMPLVCGLGLMLFPYFVDSTPWMLVDGAVLLLLPWFIRV